MRLSGYGVSAEVRRGRRSAAIQGRKPLWHSCIRIARDRHTMGHWVGSAAVEAQWPFEVGQSCGLLARQ
jgi:hypothetical protein